MNDFRDPYSTHDQIWRIKVTIPDNPDHVRASFGLKAWFDNGFGLGPEYAGLCILDGAYATSADARAAMSTGAMIWNAPRGGSSIYDPRTTPYSLAAPVYDAGTQTWSVPDHYFTVFAYQVPEPGSIFATLAGLAGLAGFGIRRRR